MEYFDYGLDPNLTDTDLDIAEFLEQSQENERSRLEQDIERIEELLEDRNRIHDEAIDELKSKLDWYLDRLETLYQRPGRKAEKQEQLKQRIQEFYQEIREEKQQRWRDRQKLEKELRELQQSLEEIKSTDLRQLL
jgi:chaperonin cofactor prefoldin